MTALPTPPIRPLTVADCLALPGDTEIRFGHACDPQATDTLRTEVPFPVEIDLDGLL